ncbi:MAG: 50S ribosomal protein L23 [Candidatus Kapabacteria bacterium]|nr:50S ribosomal protein L23 [Candidatus Kapabacteria bacterium]MBX7153804.1 50S ribosomal protein L23 [Bacteroidota bacterium]
MYHIIKRPLLTEKSTKVNGIHKHYVFEVDGTANKIQIKSAVESMFQVKVEDVRTANLKGKRKTRFTRKGIMSGKTADIKKAYVRLVQGYTIDVVSGEGEQE